MDRVRRLSTELLTRYPDKFTHNFEQNKKIINELATIRSKVLRNTVAGYITSYLRKKSGQQEAQAESPGEEAIEPPSQEIDENGGS